MKSLIKSMLCITLMCFACKSEKTETYNTVICILFDRTDHFTFEPEKIDVASLAGIDKDIWQGVKVELSSISDMDINSTVVITLLQENRFINSKKMRMYKIEKFKKDVQKALLNMANNSLAPLDHSIIYRTVATKLNALQKNEGKNKHMLIFSDLMENSQLNFYDPATFNLLSSNPKQIQNLFEKECSIDSLKNINVWLIYNPKNYEVNNIYMTVAGFYKYMLQDATIHIGNSVQ